MNKNKTGGIWVGKLKHSKDEIEGIKWYEKPFKTKLIKETLDEFLLYS
jgi:hypothetical protein